VTFNSVAAALSVVSNTQINTSVPGGATTGKIRVTTPAGLADSASAFTVTGSSTSTSVEVRVSASADDAEEQSSGTVSLTSSDLELVYDGNTQTVGMRFTGVNIPRGATIANAYVQFQVDETNSEPTALTIKGQAIDTAPTFTTATKNVTARTRTAAAVAWSPPAWTTVGAAGSDQQTPSITSVVQEIVSRPGWSSGNSLVVIINGTGHRTAKSYDGSKAGAPLLHVEYK